MEEIQTKYCALRVSRIIFLSVVASFLSPECCQKSLEYLIWMLMFWDEKGEGQKNLHKSFILWLLVSAHEYALTQTHKASNFG